MSAETIGHIASVVVHVVPDKADKVDADISAMPEAEVFARESGKIVVVIETRDDRHVTTIIDAIAALEGVLSASLVFHQSED